MRLHNEIQNPNLKSLITSRIKKSGLSRSQLVQKLGYTNVSKGCRKLDTYLDSFQPPSDEFVSKLLSVLNIDGLSFHNSLTVSLNKIAIDADRYAKERFYPYIQLLAELTITPLFARHILYNKYCLKGISRDIQDLPLQEEINFVVSAYKKQLKKFTSNMRKKHIAKYQDAGFRYYRHHNSYLEFNAEGVLVKVISDPPAPKTKEPFGNRVINMISGGAV